jgi:hypothetical protein
LQNFQLFCFLAVDFFKRSQRFHYAYNIIHTSIYFLAMSSIADRVAAKRAAATQIEGNTKKTMEGISGWSASSDASTSASSGVCGGMSEFHDLQANAGKKSRKDSNTNDTKKATESKKKDVVDPVKKTEENHTTQANKASTANSATTATTEASSSPESDCSSLAVSPSSCESSIVETVKTSRQKRAEERNVNSTGPMVLSRHISWLISKDPSPAISPLAATRLSFTPVHSTFERKTNRAR